MEVIPKHAAAKYVPEIAAITLAEGFGFLLDGSARALQLRYRYNGTIWWDTLMPIPQNTFRIARLHLPRTLGPQNHGVEWFQRIGRRRILPSRHR